MRSIVVHLSLKHVHMKSCILFWMIQSVGIDRGDIPDLAKVFMIVNALGYLCSMS